MTGSVEVHLSTFHSFSANLLRQEFPCIGRASEFTIYDEGDSLALVKRIVEKQQLDPQHFEP